MAYKNIDDKHKYNRKYMKEYRGKNKKYIDKYKLSIGCSICGYNKCVSALDFHHNGDKEFTIGIFSRSLKKIKEEIEKCDVLCANCHRELHEKLRKE